MSVVSEIKIEHLESSLNPEIEPNSDLTAYPSEIPSMHQSDDTPNISVTGNQTAEDELPIDSNFQGKGYLFGSSIKKRKCVQINGKSPVSILNEMYPGLNYKTVSKEGPAHLPTFLVTLELNGKVFEGRSSTIKAARQIVAEAAVSSCRQFYNNFPIVEHRINSPSVIDSTSEASNCPLTAPSVTKCIKTKTTIGPGDADKNPVVILNELRQGVVYDMINEIGEAHNKMFKFSVTVDGLTFEGSANSKKLARAAAAREALTKLPSLVTSSANTAQNISLSAPENLQDIIDKAVSDRLMALTSNNPVVAEILAGAVKSNSEDDVKLNDHVFDGKDPSIKHVDEELAESGLRSFRRCNLSDSSFIVDNSENSTTSFISTSESSEILPRMQIPSLLSKVESLKREIAAGDATKNPVMLLDELRQGVVCDMIGEYGEPHNRMFKFSVTVDGQTFEGGTANSKKLARTAAATEALRDIHGMAQQIALTTWENLCMQQGITDIIVKITTDKLMALISKYPLISDISAVSVKPKSEIGVQELVEHQ